MDKAFNLADSHQSAQAAHAEQRGCDHCYHAHKAETHIATTLGTNGSWICCHCGNIVSGNSHDLFAPKHGKFAPPDEPPI